MFTEMPEIFPFVASFFGGIIIGIVAAFVLCAMLHAIGNTDGED